MTKKTLWRVSIIVWILMMVAYFTVWIVADPLRRSFTAEGFRITAGFGIVLAVLVPLLLVGGYHVARFIFACFRPSTWKTLRASTKTVAKIHAVLAVLIGGEFLITGGPGGPFSIFLLTAPFSLSYLLFMVIGDMNKDNDAQTERE